MYFWAYDFKYIPIELISAIYETFLDEDRRKTSAYYTPPEIVDFVLNEVLPFETAPQDVSILDPACGSGDIPCRSISAVGYASPSCPRWSEPQF